MLEEKVIVVDKLYPIFEITNPFLIEYVEKFIDKFNRLSKSFEIVATYGGYKIGQKGSALLTEPSDEEMEIVARAMVFLKVCEELSKSGRIVYSGGRPGAKIQLLGRKLKNEVEEGVRESFLKEFLAKMKE
ncbi:hypothetical protein [Pyrococcus kukulkanii]|uniref:Uncharacterized protein n=1 Tax=Pyrococcus kukulkanii TaxID=1609559 RepID=A0ABV4T5S1_9EURY